MEKLCLDISEIAEALGISKPTVYALMRREQDPLPSFKIGSRVKFNAEAAKAWVERQTIGNNADE